MNELSNIAIFLLLGCFVCLALMIYVFRIQYRLLKKYGKDRDHKFRLTLTIATSAIIVGTFIPIVLDIASLRGIDTDPLLPFYAGSNRITFVIVCAAFALLYYMASRNKSDK